MTDHYGRHEIEAWARRREDRETPASKRRGLGARKGFPALDVRLDTRAILKGRVEQCAEPIVSQVARLTRIAEKRRKRAEVRLDWFKLGLERRWRAWSKRPGDSFQHKWEIVHLARTFVLKLNGIEVSRHRKVHLLMFRAKLVCQTLKHRPGRVGVLS